MSWYVIEGPDDTGKSTLAHGLERRGWIYQHADGRDSLPTFAQRLSMWQDYENVVFDRGHLGEMVHGPLDRNTEPSVGWFKLIEAFLLEKKVNGVLLLTRPGAPSSWENDPRRHATLGSLFSEVAAQSSLHWGRWPDPMPKDLTFGSGPDDNGDEFEWSQDRADPEGLGGGDHPVVWVLAERQNVNATVSWPLATRCGTELVWPVIDPRTIRVSNALPSAWRREVLNPYIDLHNRWHNVGQPPVIALGQATRDACQRADVPIEAALPHPQWHLRFQSKHPEVYRYHLGMAILNAQRSRV